MNYNLNLHGILKYTNKDLLSEYVNDEQFNKYIFMISFLCALKDTLDETTETELVDILKNKNNVFRFLRTFYFNFNLFISIIKRYLKEKKLTDIDLTNIDNIYNWLVKAFDYTDTRFILVANNKWYLKAGRMYIRLLYYNNYLLKYIYTILDNKKMLKKIQENLLEVEYKINKIENIEERIFGNSLNREEVEKKNYIECVGVWLDARNSIVKKLDIMQ